MLDTNITTLCNARESVAEEYTAYLLCSSLFGRVSLTDDSVEERFARRLRQEEQEHTLTGSAKGSVEPAFRFGLTGRVGNISVTWAELQLRPKHNQARQI